jgi:hypothetical protein
MFCSAIFTSSSMIQAAGSRSEQETWLSEAAKRTSLSVERGLFCNVAGENYFEVYHILRCDVL